MEIIYGYATPTITRFSISYQNNDSFTLHFQQRLILTHSKDNPCLWIGSGIADIDMFRGNFSIKDKLQEKIALTDAIVRQSPDGWLIHFSRGSDISATLNISAERSGPFIAGTTKRQP